MTQTMESTTKKHYALKPDTLKAIKRYFKKYPDASVYACSRDLKMHKATVIKYRNALNGTA